MTLLLVTAAALLLVPAAVASAGEVHIIINGTGAGEVNGVAPLNGTPPIACTYASPGPAGGVCNAKMNKNEGLEGQLVEEKAAPGSEFAGWVSEGGLPVGCEEPLAPECGVLSFGGDVTIRATFNKIPKEKFKLNLSTSGGSGSFECEVESVKGPCLSEYETEQVVKVIPVPAVGFEFVEWTGDCSGSGACEVTMSAEHSVGAKFAVASESFSVTEEGEGTVQCEVNGGGLEPCASPYTYGDAIKVVATPAAENVVGSLTGTGSAAGNCNAETGICEFVITAPSSVTAKFESAGTKDEVSGKVFGEVPITTSLESACNSVFLGEFLPGVATNYHNTCTLTATSTGEKTVLTAADESGIDTGHLTQKPGHPYSLAQALEAKASDTGGLGGVGGSLAPLTSPVTLLTYPGPVSGDGVQVEFNQPIGSHDPLHTGIYAKTITLTLEQTTP